MPVSVQRASLETQRAALLAEAERRGRDFEIVADEALSAKNMNRPGLTSALARLDAGEADFLMAIRLDRVSLSVLDFAGLMDRANRKSWGIVLITQNMDTSTPAGRLTANIVASTAQFERELISVRVSENIARQGRQGHERRAPSTLRTAPRSSRGCGDGDPCRLCGRQVIELYRQEPE